MRAQRVCKHAELFLCRTRQGGVGFKRRENRRSDRFGISFVVQDFEISLLKLVSIKFQKSFNLTLTFAEICTIFSRNPDRCLTNEIRQPDSPRIIQQQTKRTKGPSMIRSPPEVSYICTMKSPDTLILFAHVPHP
jgi:hypothetical protein